MNPRSKARDAKHSADSGEVLWRPPRALTDAANMSHYMNWLAENQGLQFDDYEQLRTWSVDELESFWASIWSYFGIESTPYECVLDSRIMPGAQWFPGSQLNFTQHVLRQANDEEPALIFMHEGEDQPFELSWDNLCHQVAAVANWLLECGVKPGDRIGALIPNIPEAVVSFLACAAVGAVWSICSPEYGIGSVLDRLGQLEPVILIAADGYRFGGKLIDRRSAAVDLRQALPSVQRVLWIPYLYTEDSIPLENNATTWNDIVQKDINEVPIISVPFDHPLWVMYSSGTTGLPKGIVHGHGGIVLEELKYLSLHHDLKVGDRFFWFTTTSWTMWNIVLSGLLTGATIVLYDGSPTYPDVGALWQVASRSRTTHMGASAAYLIASQRGELRVGESYDLTPLRYLGSTGSPLPASSFRWIYDAVKSDLWLSSESGGTDVATGFAGACPLMPVRAGEIQSRCLGVQMEAIHEDGRIAAPGEIGDLVITAPMPSMPVFLWNDPGGERYRETYFETPGVWRHGDWVTIEPSGGVIVHGRSDATINRMGVRMGSAEIYEIVEKLPEVREALVVGIERRDGDYFMPLFVALEHGVDLNEDLSAKIREALRTGLSPRHVPDDIVEIPSVPHTLTGKKLEVPVKRLLQGTPLDQAVNLGSVDDIESLRFIAEVGLPAKFETSKD